MASLIHTLVPSALYNNLPHIHEAADVMVMRKQDLTELQALLAKHNVPKFVAIRLIHKHFDTNEGEVMVFGKTAITGHGTVQTMKPVLPSDNHGLQGLHFFVNDHGSLQAYEYADHKVPEMSGYTPFLTEFCKVVTRRGLQHTFGLKLKVNDELDHTSWTEFEFHSKRGTVMIPDGMPMPEGQFEVSVSTEWTAIMEDDDTRNCKHKTTCAHGATKCTHCRHCSQHNAADTCEIDIAGSKGEISLGGQQIEPGRPIFDLVSLIAVEAF